MAEFVSPAHLVPPNHASRMNGSNHRALATMAVVPDRKQTDPAREETQCIALPTLPLANAPRLGRRGTQETDPSRSWAPPRMFTYRGSECLH
jgi:hypothetical protein